MQSPYSEEHEQYRSALRRFLDAELEPNVAKFAAAGGDDTSLWKKAGEAGLLGVTIPEAYGGPGGDKLFNVIQSYEFGRSIGSATCGSSITSDLATSLIAEFGTHEQKSRWCPGILAGDTIQSFAVTEPNAGSDVTAMRTRAVKKGGHYIINGSKTFISNINKAGLVYLFAKTNDTDAVSCFLLDPTTPGVRRTKLKTMGQVAGNVGELFLEDVKIPETDLLGAEGRGFKIAFSTFAADRLCIAGRSLGHAEAAFKLTLEHVKNRVAFGKPLFDFQNTQFKLAEMKTEIEVMHAFHERCVWDMVSGHIDIARSAMVKLHLAGAACRVVDECMQLHGGSGYMDESPISRIYTSIRLDRIYAGADEIQKLTIARSLT